MQATHLKILKNFHHFPGMQATWRENFHNKKPN
jgi:hypothetical protein